ncbi:MAG: CDP-6-deoxy-delta-3,4-glucoseen reductase [Paraburkholderia sp.]|uniref:CDP-6-deoxy-delta-3,4-glucoseen reductase n=1 Tax=Paraburkholderia sp. TaxID=1926495 RepID=UPI0012263579|nr:CDP-6-deoxy-delta-3,4-glucoseen reductase [Paraburkholderia sp.]TAL93221.1 MAG: CDP-6-deoxy-delta-3,4-glucoseen reductase [Paraburkholderia sp.]
MNDGLATGDSYPVTFEPLGRTLEVRRGETILSAALANGYPLAHSCKNGVCGSCKANVTKGVIDHGGNVCSGISGKERSEGFVLLCQAKPASAVTVICKVVDAIEGVPVRRVACRVHELERLADDVMRIRLKTPAKDPVKYLPGQYIDILMNGGIRRSLSVASSPDDAEFIELHLRNYGGPFSTHVFNKMKVSDLLRLEGPMGTFFIRDDSEKPIIFVASGTGFAPIKSMIEHQVRKDDRRSMTLYWGGRRPSDLYLDTLAQEWVKEHGVNYVPVVSDPRPEDAWSGRTGFVHRAVMEDFPDLSGHQVYACGAPIVVQSAQRDFIEQCNLPESEFYADMFVSSTPPTP